MRNRKKANVSGVELGWEEEKLEVDEAPVMKGFLSYGKRYEF